MKKQRYIVEIEMPDGDFISAEWLKDLIQTDCNLEDEGRNKVTVQETSLPTNMEEAVEKIASDIAPTYPDIGWDECFEKIKEGIKYGAKWMAEQGQTFAAHVDNGCAIASGVKLPFILWDTYEDGDVLKVQLRKINEKEE